MRFSTPFPIEKSSETLVEEILRGERNDLLAKTCRTLLYPPSLCYGAAIKFRNFLYDQGALHQYSCDATVISVGNVVMGGSGKTPFVLMLAKKLKGPRLAILSRGYKGKSECQTRKVSPADEASLVGGEALLLAQNLPHASVWVGRDRVASAKKAVEEGAQVILLDDGLQHRRLYRDFEIIVVSGKNPLQNLRYLPAGILRDDPRRLDRADLIITTEENAIDDPRMVGVKNEFKEVVFADGRAKKSLDGVKMALFCGISFPKRFMSEMEKRGEIVSGKFLPDHGKFEFEKLKEFARSAKKKGATLLLCTEKDFVKCDHKKLDQLALPLAFVRSECVVTKNEEALNLMMDAMVKKIKRGCL